MILPFLFLALLASGCATEAVKEGAFADPCSMKPEVGHCKAAIPRFFYDETAQVCRQFIWSGCQGRVPFETLEACEAACAPDTPASLLQQLDAGEKRWLASKAAHGASYDYQTEFHSWVGFGHRTRVVVKNNRVSERHFESWQRDRQSGEKWVELTPDALGRHKMGADPLTMDQLYQRCRDDVLSKSTSAYDLSLRVGEFGQLVACTYRHLQCADDCTQGIALSGFSFAAAM